MGPISWRTWIWVKTMFSRITISKITACFFLFSFLHCFIHAVVQSVLFSFDHDANNRVSTIVHEAQVPTNQVAWLQRKDGNFTLKLCQDHVPVTKESEEMCKLIFQTGAAPIEVPTGFRKRDVKGQRSKKTVRSITNVQPVQDPSGGVAVEFSSTAVDDGSKVLLDAQCTRVLVYAGQVLKNSKREELALIGSEFWLLGISIFAIMYDSIPHLIAGFFMRVLSTAWSAYEIWRTGDIHTRFDTLITNGACNVDLFPHYFHDRLSVQIADLVLNVIALVLSAFLVSKLVKTYANCMFARLGAPKHLIKLYRLFCGVFICLQMSVYLLVAALSLWVDQLINGPLVKISSNNTLYIVLFIAAIVVLIPWIALGWFSVRREMRRTMLAFLFVGTLYFTGWCLVYYSKVFRWTWLQWPFFASLSVAAQVVQLASIVLGVFCWRNFHRGLAQYFHADNLLTKADFEPEVFTHAQGGAKLEAQPFEEGTFQVDFKIVNVKLHEDQDDASDMDVDKDSVIDVRRDSKEGEFEGKMNLGNRF